MMNVNQQEPVFPTTHISHHQRSRYSCSPSTSGTPHPAPGSNQAAGHTEAVPTLLGHGAMVPRKFHQGIVRTDLFGDRQCIPVGCFIQGNHAIFYGQIR